MFIPVCREHSIDHIPPNQMNLTLQINQNDAAVKRAGESCNFTTPTGGSLMICPPVGQDYWIFRVAVSEKQAVVGFPKFGVIGIGFQFEEEDWNTNLPSSSDAEEIYEHIKVNKGAEPTREDCIAAIKMIQAAAEQLRNAKPNPPA